MYGKNVDIYYFCNKIEIDAWYRDSKHNSSIFWWKELKYVYWETLYHDSAYNSFIKYVNLTLNKWSDIDPLAFEPEPGVGAEPEPGVEPEPCSCETGAKGCNLNPWIDKKKGGTVVKLILFKHF